MEHRDHPQHDDATINALAQQYGVSLEEVTNLWDRVTEELKAGATNWDYLSVFALRRVRDILDTLAR
jgi:hypothetical protein